LPCGQDVLRPAHRYDRVALHGDGAVRNYEPARVYVRSTALY
jgi:hypothetical protein